MSFRTHMGIIQFQLNDQLQKLAFYEGTNIIGRNPNKANIPIKNKSISQIHAKLICKPKTISIVDCGSKNGVYINDFQHQIAANQEIVLDCAKDIVYISDIRVKIIPEWEVNKNLQEDTVGIDENKMMNNKEKNKEKIGADFQPAENVIEKHAQQESRNKITKKRLAKQQKSNDKERSKQTKKNQKQDKNKDKNKKDTIDNQQENKDEGNKKNNKSKQMKGKQKISKQKAEKNKKKEQEDKKQQNKSHNTSMEKQNKMDIEQKQERKKGNDSKETLDPKNAKQKQNLQQKKQSISKNKQKREKQKKQEEDLIKNKQSKQVKIEQNEEVENKKKKKSRKSGDKPSKSSDKRAESSETMVKKKKKNKSMDKNSKPNVDSLQNRKRIIWSKDEHRHSKRHIQQKFALTSNYHMTFSPSVRIYIVNSHHENFDVLVMDKYMRTFKLLYAITKGIPVVSFSWIMDSEYKRKIMPIDRYLLDGPYKNLIKQSIQKVKQGFKVFDGLSFFLISPKYHMPASQIEQLIEQGGGNLITQISKVKKTSVVIVSNDYGHDDLLQIKAVQHCQKIYTVELIMDSCLKQQIDWSANQIARVR